MANASSTYLNSIFDDDILIVVTYSTNVRSILFLFFSLCTKLNCRSRHAFNELDQSVIARPFLDLVIPLPLHVAREPYQYVGGTENTVTWGQAPTAVVGSRELILKRMKQALGIHGGFNEVIECCIYGEAENGCK